jgi:hypothetical protein
LAEDRFEEQISTHGMRLWPMPAERLNEAMAAPAGERRELVIWDLGRLAGRRRDQSADVL